MCEPTVVLVQAFNLMNRMCNFDTQSTITAACRYSCQTSSRCSCVLASTLVLVCQDLWAWMSLSGVCLETLVGTRGWSET